MMQAESPGFIRMTRAQGLLATFLPLSLALTAAFLITGEVKIVGFLLALSIGSFLHLAMNIYNDVYDTRSGADTLDSSKSMFSGGSGVLIEHPNLESNMLLMARTFILLALLSALFLALMSDGGLTVYIILITLAGAFFAKYYSAPPIKLSYRGLGEAAVFISFGPLAVTMGALSQGLIWDPLFLAIMPVTGLVPLIVTWNGQIVDLPYDERVGKMGLVMHLGLDRALAMMPVLHLLLIASLVNLVLISPSGWILASVLVPYTLLMVVGVGSMMTGGEERLYRGASLNFASLVILSICIIAAFPLASIL